MSTIHAHLSSVLRVTKTSVFFTPSADHAIDLETISYAPAAHRQLLQENGLAAKVWLTVEVQPSIQNVTDSTGSGKSVVHTHPVCSPPSPSSSDLCIDRNISATLAVDARASVWRSALVEAKLVEKSPSKAGLLECITSAVVWPLICIEDYVDRKFMLHARRAASAVTSSSFCLPILSVQETTCMSPHGRVWMTVIWMPRYPMDLATWSRTYLDHNQWPPEKSLISLIHSATLGLLALNTIDSSLTSLSHHNRAAAVASADLSTPVKPSHALRESAEWKASSVPRGQITNLTMDKVLVCLDSGRPRFVLSASSLFDHRSTYAWSATHNRCRNSSDKHFMRNDVQADKDEDDEDWLRMSRLYLAPEQLVHCDTPTCPPRAEVWALGVIVYFIARGTTMPSHALASMHITAHSEEQQQLRSSTLPLNHPRLPPSILARVVRHDLKRGNYSGLLKGLLLLLLGQDYRTRPTLTLLDKLLQDLNRDKPVCRFPFTLGSLDLLKVPEPECVQIHPAARRYRSSETCCVCHHPRTHRQCRSCEREIRGTSGSWSGVELLPGLMTVYPLRMMFLYPLIDAHTDDRTRRRLLRRALLPVGRPGSRNNTENDVNITEDAAGGGRVGEGVGGVREISSIRMSRQSHKRNERRGNNSRQSHCGSLDSQTIDRQALFQQFGGFALYEHKQTSLDRVAGEEKDGDESRACCDDTAASAANSNSNDYCNYAHDKNGAPTITHSFSSSDGIGGSGRSGGPNSERVSAYEALVHEIFVPFPHGALRPSEEEYSIVRLHTLAGLPWPSYCTQQVHARSGMAQPVPLLFRGLQPQPLWFSWIAPNEQFVLENGIVWTPAVDGAFLFLFDENLESTEYDRYFPLASLRALSVQDKVARTGALDYSFRKHLMDAEGGTTTNSALRTSAAFASYLPTTSLSYCASDSSLQFSNRCAVDLVKSCTSPVMDKCLDGHPPLHLQQRQQKQQDVRVPGDGRARRQRNVTPTQPRDRRCSGSCFAAMHEATAEKSIVEIDTDVVPMSASRSVTRLRRSHMRLDEDHDDDGDAEEQIASDKSRSEQAMAQLSRTRPRVCRPSLQAIEWGEHDEGKDNSLSRVLPNSSSDGRSPTYDGQANRMYTRGSVMSSTIWHSRLRDMADRHCNRTHNDGSIGAGSTATGSSNNKESGDCNSDKSVHVTSCAEIKASCPTLNFPALSATQSEHAELWRRHASPLQHPIERSPSHAAIAHAPRRSSRYIIDNSSAHGKKTACSTGSTYSPLVRHNYSEKENATLTTGKELVQVNELNVVPDKPADPVVVAADRSNSNNTTPSSHHASCIHATRLADSVLPAESSRATCGKECVEQASTPSHTPVRGASHHPTRLPQLPPPASHIAESVEAWCAPVTSSLTAVPASVAAQRHDAECTRTPMKDGMACLPAKDASAQSVEKRLVHSVATPLDLDRYRTANASAEVCLPSAFCSSPAVQPQAALATATAAAVSHPRTLVIRACWHPPGAVDVTFRSMSFYISRTGEHGLVQEPVRMTSAMRSALRASPTSYYLAFLSNQLPLIEHNHVSYRQRRIQECDIDSQLLLPPAHHRRNTTVMRENNNMSKPSSYPARTNSLYAASQPKETRCRCMDAVPSPSHLRHRALSTLESTSALPSASSSLSLLLRHHGFAVYDENGVLEGVVALRLSMSKVNDNAGSPLSARPDDFVLPTHLHSVQLSTLAYSELIYSSFFDDCLADIAVMHPGTRRIETNWITSTQNLTPAGASDCVGKIIVHSPVTTEKALKLDDLRVREVSPELAFTRMNAQDCSLAPDSSDRAVSDVNDHDALTLSNGFQFAYSLAQQERSWTSAADLSIHTFRSLCWVGFDRASMQLMFSDLRREFWMSYTIGLPDSASITSSREECTPSISSEEAKH